MATCTASKKSETVLEIMGADFTVVAAATASATLQEEGAATAPAGGDSSKKSEVLLEIVGADSTVVAAATASATLQEEDFAAAGDTSIELEDMALCFAALVFMNNISAR